jgi:hypothetical protein
LAGLGAAVGAGSAGRARLGLLRLDSEIAAGGPGAGEFVGPGEVTFGVPRVAVPSSGAEAGTAAAAAAMIGAPILSRAEMEELTSEDGHAGSSLAHGYPHGYGFGYARTSDYGHGAPGASGLFLPSPSSDGHGSFAHGSAAGSDDALVLGLHTSDGGPHSPGWAPGAAGARSPEVRVSPRRASLAAEFGALPPLSPPSAFAGYGGAAGLPPPPRQRSPGSPAFAPGTFPARPAPTPVARRASARREGPSSLLDRGTVGVGAGSGSNVGHGSGSGSGLSGGASSAAASAGHGSGSSNEGGGPGAMRLGHAWGGTTPGLTLPPTPLETPPIGAGGLLDPMRFAGLNGSTSSGLGRLRAQGGMASAASLQDGVDYSARVLVRPGLIRGESGATFGSEGAVEDGGAGSGR